MTLRKAGWLGGCPFAIVTDEGGKEEKYVCTECGLESPPNSEAFLQVRAKKCGRPKGTPPTPPVEETTTKKKARTTSAKE